MEDERYIEEYNEEDGEIDQEFQAEDQRDIQEDVYSDQTPTYKEKDDLWTLFKWVIGKDDSSKVGNLNKQELGMLDISVRDCLRIRELAYTLGHNGFGDFFGNQAEMILATSCSRDGQLLNLFVSQRKFSTKSKDSGNVQNLLNQPKKKKGLFNRK